MDFYSFFDDLFQNLPPMTWKRNYFLSPCSPSFPAFLHHKTPLLPSVNLWTVPFCTSFFFRFLQAGSKLLKMYPRWSLIASIVKASILSGLFLGFLILFLPDFDVWLFHLISLASSEWYSLSYFRYPAEHRQASRRQRQILSFATLRFSLYQYGQKNC